MPGLWWGLGLCLIHERDQDVFPTKKLPGNRWELWRIDEMKIFDSGGTHTGVGAVEKQAHNKDHRHSTGCCH